MSLDPDRQLGLALVAVAALALASLGTLGYVAATAGDDADPMQDVRWRLDRANDTHVRVGHAGGPPVPAASRSTGSNAGRRGAALRSRGASRASCAPTPGRA